MCVDLATVLVSLVVEVSGTVALPMEQIANVRFMILILYGRTHKRHTIDAVVALLVRCCWRWVDSRLPVLTVHTGA